MESLMAMLPTDNQFFTGGLGIAALGVAASVARRAGSIATLTFRRHCMVTLEVTSKDLSYPWVLQWLNTQGRRTQHLSVSTLVKKMADGRRSALSFDLVPGPGQHIVWHKGRPYSVERVREQQMLDLNSGTPWEKILFTTFGRDTDAFTEVLREARDQAVDRDEGKLIVYTNWGTDWRPFGHPRSKRPLGSVILGAGVKEKIVGDMHEWQNAAGWYTERGIPYRRGYLLHGPPGCGKSSFVSAVAGHFDYNICILSLNEAGLTDDRLAQALSNVPQQSVVLLEDIDAAFYQRNPGEYNRSHVTFSGLLNTLDGVSSAEERILFMTTNHIERLEPALLRPGRVDAVHFIDYATEDQVAELFHNFYPRLTAIEGAASTDGTSTDVASEEGATDRSSLDEVGDDSRIDLAREFASRVTTLGEQRFSIAEIQGYLMDYKSDAAAATRNVHLLEEMHNSRTASAKTNTAQQQQQQGNVSANSVRGSGARRVTSLEADKMPFNPQDGWEEQVGVR